MPKGQDPLEWKKIEIKLQPKQHEARKRLKDFKYLFYGGAKGGGKSYLQRAIHVEWITTKHNVVTAIIRRNYKDVKTNHIDKIFKEYPQLERYYKKSDQCIKIPETGSILYFGHCKDERSLEKWKGVELQLIGIDEVDNFPWQWVVKLLQSNRSSDPAVNARALLTGNPGGMCHAWLKRVFIDRQFRERERPKDYAFVQALLDDNKYISSDDYEHTLNLEPNEQIRRAYRYGDWDIQAGEFFHEFTHQDHVIEPLNLEDIKDWYKFGAMDWGYYHPCSFGWFAVNPTTQQVILYREFMDRERSIQQVKDEIFKYDDTHHLKYVVAGRDCWVRQRDGSPSVESKFALKDPTALMLTKANDDRVQGWNHVRSFLNLRSYGKGEDAYQAPRFLITKNCGFTIEAFPRMQHSKKNPEDCETFNCHADDDLGSGDDQIQMVRYGLMSIPEYGKLLSSSKRKFKAGAKKHIVGASSWSVV